MSLKRRRIDHRCSTFFALTLLCGASSVSCARDCTEAQYKSDRPKMELAFGTGILKNDEQGGTSLFISEQYWTQMNFEQKVDFTESLSCAVAGVGKAIATITFRSNMTGKTIGEWSWGKLTVP